MNTTVWAVVVAAVVPVVVMIGQNWVARRGKKDDMQLARENLLMQREAAVEKVRVELAVKTEADLKDCEDRLRGSEDKRDSLEEQVRSLRGELDQRNGELKRLDMYPPEKAFAYIKKKQQEEIEEWRRANAPGKED